MKFWCLVYLASRALHYGRHLSKDLPCKSTVTFQNMWCYHLGSEDNLKNRFNIVGLKHLNTCQRLSTCPLCIKWAARLRIFQEYNSLNKRRFEKTRAHEPLCGQIIFLSRLYDSGWNCELSLSLARSWFACCTFEMVVLCSVFEVNELWLRFLVLTLHSNKKRTFTWILATMAAIASHIQASNTSYSSPSSTSSSLWHPFVPLTADSGGTVNLRCKLDLHTTAVSKFIN